MSIESHGHEHEFEPEYGLPDVRAMAIHVFHLRKLAIYFGLLLVLHAANVAGDGGDAVAVAASLVWPLALVLMALLGVGVLAWLTARTTVYTLTNKRVVMRVGIVLTLTFNLPLRWIAGAALAQRRDGSGDITLALAGSDRIAWLQLWPHVRPWRLRKPEPMLRCVPAAAVVAARLSQAWAAAQGVTLEPAAPASEAPAGSPQPNPGRLQPSLS
jgi:hypothetical protein